jgi:pimeloyl-ACP methyl ester carboxylesterase
LTCARLALITLLAAAAGACLSSARPAQSPVLTVLPAEGPINAPFQVIVRGVAPGVRVKITADRVSNDGEKWTSSAFFIANRLSTVNPAEAPSLDGSYRGLSPHGLYCSVLPATADSVESFVADYHNRPDQPSSIYTPMARSPITVTAFIAGREIGAVTVWRGFAIGTAGQDVSGPTGWRGQYFPPAPGVPLGEPIVVLSGSGGGLFDTTAALLASNGHPTLALAIYNYQDLPKALLNRPLEQVRDGALWLATKAGTDRAAVLGISRGSEAAQLAAAYFPDAFSGVIAEVPSHLIGGALGPGTTPADSAWSLGGTPIPPFSMKVDFAKIAEAAETLPGYRGSADLLPIWNDPSVEATSMIPYERIRAPLLILAGAADDLWPSYVSAEHIRRRMESLGKEGQVEIHVFPDAGHRLVAVGTGNAVSSSSYSSSLKGYMSTGGTPNGNCEASFDAFAEMLRFLDRLKPAV